MYKINKQTRGIEFVDFTNKFGFHVILSNYGASIYEIDVLNKNNEPEIITLTPMQQFYFNNSKYFGLTVGRVAGRIDNAEFDVNGEHFKGTPNEGINMLHGGINNLSYRFYNYDIKEDDSKTIVKYSVLVKHLEDEFPGDLELNVIYTLYDDINKIDLEYQAMSNKDTLLNLTNHSYFNLSGNLKSTILNHILAINKEQYSIFRDDLKLIGLNDVTTKFDFRNGLEIGKYIKDKEVVFPTNGYDHYFSGNDNLKVRLHDPISKRSLYIESDYKDVVIYANNNETNTVFINNVNDSKNIGIAIEPSRFTKILKDKDGILLKANELYNYHISYTYKEEE